MSWLNANAWAAELEFLSFTNWRLPIGVPVLGDPSCDLIQYLGGGRHYGEFFNYNCTASEMGHLFSIELGGVVDVNANSSVFDETVFDGLLHNNYWSSTEADPACYSTSTNDCAWDYDFKNSVTEDYPINLNFHALAVHNGDIGGLGAIPIPPSVFLFTSGLIGLAAISRFKRA